MTPPAGSHKKSRSHGKRKGHPSSGKKSARKAKTECPECKGLIPKDAMECPLCGAGLSGPVITEEKPTEAPPPLEGEGERPIPETGETPAEHPEPAPAETAVEPVATEAEIPPPEVKVEEPPAEAKTVSATKIEEEIPPKMRACPGCGTVASASFDKCPMCGTSFSETTEPRIPAEPTRSARAVRQRKLAAPRAPAPPEAKSTKKRKLKTAKVTPVPAEARKGSEGFTNGLGHVNGLARRRTEGHERSDSFVNGTGVSDDLGKKEAETPGRRSPVLRRWQFLAVAVVVILIISTFVILSYSQDHPKFSIDGDFSDWNGATTYSAESEYATPSGNITEWAVGNDGNDLFMYLRTEANMMSSSSAESYYLFVDSDGTNETGYTMESIGADYLFQITGWESEVRSASLLIFPQSTVDQYNWGAWTFVESLSCSRYGTRMEAGGSMPEALSDSARFMLVSKDSAERGAVSYVAAMSGGLLIVHQAPSAGVLATGTVAASADVALLELTFTCEGAGGKVDQITPTLVGATLAGQLEGFSLTKGQEHVVTVSVDATGMANGSLVSGELLATGIVSNFASVQVVGAGARAYAVAAPSEIVIDGAFADWDGKLSVDKDLIPVTSPNNDIDEVGNVSNAERSFFYVSVQGEMCSGSFIPAAVAKSSGGGGGTVVPSRRTAEDVLNVYIDSDRLATTGQSVWADSKAVGADYKIEIRGMFGHITSAKEFIYSLSPRDWIDTLSAVTAAKDDHRIEVSVGAMSLGGSSNIDFIIVTTSWSGRGDVAAFDPSAMAPSRTWIVEPATGSPIATATSNQRKLFFDGTNYWSFYFDGADTVYRCSNDWGVTWSSAARAFKTAGVSKVSVWFDEAEGIVYAVGDTAISSRAIAVQRGVVDPAGQTIAWDAKDSLPSVSILNQAGKNTFISKDATGHLWVLASNNTGAIPIRQDLSTFRSASVDNITSWVHTGNLIGTGYNIPNCKGSILPAGRGSDMWAIYCYGGNVASRKYNTSWSAENIIYAIGGGVPSNTDNSPPSAVVDSKGVVHVVYGTGRKSGSSSAPTIEYSRNMTDQLVFTPGVNLDPGLGGKLGDFYPTISLFSSTPRILVLWVQTDAALIPRTVVGRICIAGAWSDFIIAGQTSFEKNHLTSVYSVSDAKMLCWQWTQNSTAPMEVICDSTEIPEFSGAALIVVAIIAVLAPLGRSLRSRTGKDY